MVAPQLPHQLMLRKVNGREWRIENTAFAVDDSRRLLACIYEGHDAVDVVWAQGIPLPGSYPTAHDVFLSITVWLNPVPRNTAPTPIPHFAPTRRIA